MVEKCCYFMPLDSGALVLGVLTLILSTTMGIYSVVLLGVENATPKQGSAHFSLILHIDLDSKALKIVLAIIIMVQLLWMIFSVLLIIGLRKNRPSYLLGYFSFGIVMAILMMLVGLLVLLKEHWIMSVVQFIAAVVYIHGLIVVYHRYEKMQQGYGEWQDEEQLWNTEEEEMEPRP